MFLLGVPGAATFFWSVSRLALRRILRTHHPYCAGAQQLQNAIRSVAGISVRVAFTSIPSVTAVVRAWVGRGLRQRDHQGVMRRLSI